MSEAKYQAFVLIFDEDKRGQMGVCAPRKEMYYHTGYALLDVFSRQHPICERVDECEEEERLFVNICSRSYCGAGLEEVLKAVETRYSVYNVFHLSMNW